jgi:hypothetical protein
MPSDQAYCDKIFVLAHSHCLFIYAIKEGKIERNQNHNRHYKQRF